MLSTGLHFAWGILTPGPCSSCTSVSHASRSPLRLAGKTAAETISVDARGVRPHRSSFCEDQSLSTTHTAFAQHRLLNNNALT